MTSQNGRATWDTGEPVITPARKAAAPAPQPKPDIKPCWLITAGGAASVIIGAVLCASGVAHGNDGFSGQAATSGNSTQLHLGIALIVIPVLAGLITLAVQFVRDLAREIARERAWKATLSPQDRRTVEIAETAALWAAWGAVHYGLKALNEHSAARTATMREHMASVEHLNDNLPSRSWEQPSPAPRVTASGFPEAPAWEKWAS